ncbi:zinc finger BED domain-containing protein RICESLEEPER 2-like [Capsicum galapagoense]
MTENTTTDETVILGDESTNSNIARQTHSVQTTVKKERKGLVHGIILDHLLMKKEIRNQGGVAGDVAVVSWKFEQEQCRRALCRMVIVDELPFRFVEKEGFRNFMKVAQPYFKILSRNTVTRDCFKMFDEEKQKLKRSFRDAQQRVCLTTDTWISLQRINYKCITAHWIDSKWIMHKRIINFFPIISHRGENMANEISKCLRDWGINKIFTITVDNASSNDVTVKELAKIFTKRGTNFMNGEHFHVRKAVKYIRQSPARCKRFQECCEDVDINSKKSLCLDVSTRWNSTYLMLNRVVECENGLMSYVYCDIGLSHYLQFVEDEERTVVGAFSSDDWDYLISSDDNGDDLLGKITSNMKEKFDKYWGSPKKMNKMIFISCVLDPRHKFVSVGFALQMMFGKEEGLILESEVKDYMNLMYGEYVKDFSKDKDSQHYLSSSSSLFENSSSLPSISGSTIQSIGFLGSFMDDLMKHKARNITTVKTELQKYLNEANEGETKNFNVLSWWKIHSSRFSILAEMARDVLSIPISSVASECAFSTGGRIFDSFRSSLTPKLVQILVYLQDWIRSESQPVSIEEDIDVLEKLEQELANTSILDD